MNLLVEQFKKDYKRDVLARIIVALKRGSMTKSESKVLARLILNAFKLPGVDSIQAISKISQAKEEILNVFIKRYEEYEDKYKSEKLNSVRMDFGRIKDATLTNFKIHNNSLRICKGGEN